MGHLPWPTWLIVNELRKVFIDFSLILERVVFVFFIFYPFYKCFVILQNLCTMPDSVANLKKEDNPFMYQSHLKWIGIERQYKRLKNSTQNQT